MRVLIVDDAAFMRRMLRNIIEQLGYTVVGEAENGEDAFEKYQQLNPDVVTMDITMPVLDGLGGVKKIVEYDANAKIVMCSAMGQHDMVVEAVRLGAKDFIVKPFQPERVAAALAKFQ